MARFLVLLIVFAVGLPSALARDLEKLYEKAKFKIGSTPIEAYVADDDQRRSQGLMHITKLPPNTGMLFIFDQQQVQSFWMKNTLIPLSIGFFDNEAKLVDVQEMEIAPSILSLKVPTYRSRKPARFALEMTSGWYSKNKIIPGARLQLVSATESSLLKAAFGK